MLPASLRTRHVIAAEIVMTTELSGQELPALALALQPVPRPIKGVGGQAQTQIWLREFSVELPRNPRREDPISSQP